jgi:hypothetical protein
MKKPYIDRLVAAASRVVLLHPHDWKACIEFRGGCYSCRAIKELVALLDEYKGGKA